MLIPHIKFQDPISNRSGPYASVTDAQTMERPKPIYPLHNKMTCAPSEDSDQPGHPPSQSDQSSLCFFLVDKDPMLLHADSED